MHPLQEQERARRDREAGAYDAFFPPWRIAAETREVVRRIQRLNGAERMTVVDLGTGTGRIPVALRGLVARVIGVDFSAPSLEIARSAVLPAGGTSYDLVVGDVLSTGLPDGCADVVTSVQVLQHMPTEDARDGHVREACRLLRPGGRVIVACYGRNVLHRLRGGPERTEGGLYSFRHSCGDLRTRLRKSFSRVRVSAAVGLPDWIPSPRIDAWMSRLPGWGLMGRTVIGEGVKPGSHERRA